MGECSGEKREFFGEQKGGGEGLEEGSIGSG